MLATMCLPRTGGSVGHRSASQRAIAAACVGNAAEWYDFAIYGALATVIAHVYFPAADPAAALSAAFAAYGTALLVRPLGALVFGRMGDRRGRRAVLILVILLMAGATSVVAFLPGYAAIGLLAPIALVLLRAVQGLAAGGELGVAAVFLLEHASDSQRGRTGAWHTATMGIGIGFGMAVVAVLGLRVRGREQRLGLVADRLLDRHSPRRDGAAATAPVHRHRAVPDPAGSIRSSRSSCSGALDLVPKFPVARVLLARGRFARFQHLFHLHAE